MPRTTKDEKQDRLDRVIAGARRDRELREQSYREQALKLFPWVCARCGREFTRGNVSQLTVHHKDHDHDNNPPDGSNWELLCLYCHDAEHTRYLNAGSKAQAEGERDRTRGTYKAFADLGSRLKGEDGT